MLASMAGMIPQAFINRLVERVDSAEVIGARVQLKKAGNNHVGLCPFHNEKTPSFHVYADGYHCFGCGAHGTSLGFLMEMDGLTFPEAVESLAALVGLEVPREQADRRPQPETAGLREPLDAAAERYRGWLRHHAEGPAAIAYLKGRGLGGAVLDDYQVGLAPSGWDSLKNALAKFGEDKLCTVGLLVKNDKGRSYDRFRARIVFPIRDTRGRVVGFGGRVYDGSGARGEGPRQDDAKYINSPATPVFNKGAELYGLFEARRAERNPDALVVVEGYLDVLALAAHGFTSAVATLGTAVGEAHFKRLFRHVDRVVCCFDGDAAGRAAAWKAVDAAFPALSARRTLGFVFLPEGEDPDTVARDKGAGHFRALVADAVPVGEFFLAHLREGLNLEQLDHRATLCDLALPHLVRLPDGPLRALLLAELAELASVDAATLTARLRSERPPATPVPGVPAPPETWSPAKSTRAELVLHRLVQRPAAFQALIAEQQAALAQESDVLAEVAGFLVEHPQADTAMLLGWFMAEPAYARLAELAGRPLPLSDADAVCAEVAEAAANLLEDRRRQQRQALAERVRQQGSLDDLRQLAAAKRAARKAPAPA